ncbi:MAG: phosphatidylserine decarboxylase [Hyphomicrobiaceae bacterium]
MSDHRAFLDRIGEPLAGLHRDGQKFVALGVVATVLLWLVWSPLGWLAALATLWIGYFFRDPERVTPLRDGLVVAPADGIVIDIDEVAAPLELGLAAADRTRIAIHLSLMDVHIKRAPVAGRIVASAYVPGAFAMPTADKASEDNERRSLVIETPAGDEIVVVQIAGPIVRRIVTFAGEGDTVGIGQRFGLIRFGSRVDLYLPPGRRALVAVGQRMVAGETVVADLKSDEGEREARRS